MVALSPWPRRLLGLSALALLAAAEGPVNLYGWPVFVRPVPLEEAPTRVPAFRAGDSAQRVSGGLLLGGDAAYDGDLVLGADMELAFVASYDRLSAVELDSLDPLWSQETEYERWPWPSPDGELALYTSEMGVGVVDVRSGRVQARWALEDDDDWLSLGASAISPDGERAVIFRSDRVQLELREMPGGALIEALSVADAADTLRFSPDGERLFGYGSDGLRVWELDSGRVLYVEDDPRWWAGAVTADLGEAYMVGDRGLLEAIELKPEGRRRAWRLPGEPALNRVVALEDGRVAVSGEAPAIYVVDTRSGQLTHALEGHGELSLSADGRWLRALADGHWAAWRVKDLEPRRVGPLHLGDVQALALQGGLVASGDERGSVLVRQVKDGALLAHIFGDSGPVTGLALPPKGSPAEGSVLIGDAWGQIWLIDLKTQGVKTRLDFGSVGWEAGEVTALAFSEDGRSFAAGLRGDDCDSCGQVRFYDAETYAVLGELKGEGYDRLLPWRGLFVASGYESAARVLSSEGPAALRGESDYYEQETWAAPRADGALVFAREGRDADLLYGLGQAEPTELDTCGPFGLSHDGRRLIAEDCAGGIAVIDTHSGRQIGNVPWPVDEGDDWVMVAVADAETLALGWGSGRVSVHRLPGTPSGGASVGGEPLGPLGTLKGDEGWAAPTRPVPESMSPESWPEGLERPYRQGDCDVPIALSGGRSVCADGRVQLLRGGSVVQESDYLGYGELVADGDKAWHVADGDLTRLSLGADSLSVDWTVPLAAPRVLDLAYGGGRLLVVSPFASALVDADSGAVLRFLEGHPGGAEVGALSPDGATAATGSQEGAVVWRDGVPWMFIPSDASQGVTFSEDGRTLVTLSRFSVASAWPLGR